MSCEKGNLILIIRESAQKEMYESMMLALKRDSIEGETIEVTKMKEVYERQIQELRFESQNIISSLR